ncbi:LPXTG cell wall anchor domain-containing protein, partial [Enterococcus termitis]
DNASGDNTGVSSLPRTNDKRDSIYVVLGGLLILFSFAIKMKSREAD